MSDSMPRDYLLLLKPRVMSLSIFTAWVGMILAPGSIHFGLGCIALLAIALGAGASATLNMWWDADIDALMHRTQRRPIPVGRIIQNEALAFGIALTLISVLLLGLATNLWAALALAFTIFFYAVIYTMLLKRWTDQNIVIGGAAGALPPVVGWLAVSPDLTWFPLWLFLIIFLWTPPHFWALSILGAADYRRAGVPMLPLTRGLRTTQRQILLYTLLLALASYGPIWTSDATWLYGALLTPLNGGFLVYAFRLWQAPEVASDFTPAQQLFLYSLFYLFGVYLAFLLDHLFTTQVPL